MTQQKKNFGIQLVFKKLHNGITYKLLTTTEELNTFLINQVNDLSQTKHIKLRLIVLFIFSNNEFYHKQYRARSEIQMQ